MCTVMMLMKNCLEAFRIQTGIEEVLGKEKDLVIIEKEDKENYAQ